MASVTYNFVQKIFSLMSKKSGDENDELSCDSNKPKSILMEIQKILIWDDPFFSCCCMICVNLIFWLIIYLDFKFYGIFFTTLLILTCEQLWMEHFSKYLNKSKNSSQNASDSSMPSGESSTEINTFFKKCLIMLKETYIKARSLRQSQPGMFCVLICLSFLLLGVIGRSLSGIIAFYILLMLIMTVPGALIRFLPQHAIKSLSNFFYSSRKESFNDIDDEVGPFLPDTSEEALELLRLAGDLQLPNTDEDEESNDLLLERISQRTSDTTESICSKMSLYPESAVMPSPENSMDFWDFDLPSKEKAEFSGTESINFQSKHFDGDSSEEEFVKSLELSGEIPKMNKKSEKQQNISNLSAENLNPAGKKFPAKEQKQRDLKGSDKESSSDTDSFELISEGDM